MPFLLLLREAAVLFSTAIASYTDLRTGLIYDKLTYPMIALGALLNIYIGVFANFMDMANYFAVALAVFAICYLLYYTGKIGGGDVKLFVGISLLLPYLPGHNYPFILLVVFVSAIIAIAALSLYYVPKYFARGADFALNKQGIFNSSLFAVFFALYFSLLLQLQFIQVQFVALLAAVVVFALLFIAFEKGIRKEFFLKEIPIGKFEEDEIVAWDFLDERLKQKINESLKLHGKRVFEKREIEKLKKLKIARLPVYRNLPKFAPFVFAAVIVIIALPDLFAGFGIF